MNDRHRIQKLKRKMFGTNHRWGAYYYFRQVEKRRALILDLCDRTPIETGRTRQALVAWGLVATIAIFMLFLGLVAVSVG